VTTKLPPPLPAQRHDATRPSPARILFDQAENYDSSSATQQTQGERLLGMVALRRGERVLDVGCGNGALTLRMARAAPGLVVHAMDISPTTVALAARHGAEAGASNVTFETGDVLALAAQRSYDVVFSNAAMHWVLPPKTGYRKLHDALAGGGRLAVHQGGHGTYRGLHQCALDLGAKLGLTKHFAGWTYPAYYPSAEELAALLADVGFAHVAVQSRESDGREHSTLVRDFSNAGLLPFLARLPAACREQFKRDFVQAGERDKVDLYTHRLLAFGRRP